MLRGVAVWALKLGCIVARLYRQCTLTVDVGFLRRFAQFAKRANAGEVGEGRIWSETTSWGEHRICSCASMCSIAIRLLPERGAS